MRAKEFVTEAPLYPETSREISSLAKQAGYKPIGSGVDARVYQHPKKKTGKVIKILIGQPGRPTHAAKKGFLQFYKFVKQNPNNPYLPKFGTPTALTLGKETVISVPMEPLIPVRENRSNIKDWYIKYFMDYALDDSDWEEFYDYLEEMNDQGHHKFLFDAKNKKFFEQLKGFYKTIKKADLYASKMGLGELDLHIGNVMKRRDGTPVLTDPFVVWGGDEN